MQGAPQSAQPFGKGWGKWFRGNDCQCLPDNSSSSHPPCAVGWLEGMRLSDGERGWFPVQQVEFISNPEVRSQNLKEAHRVKMAKLQLVEQQT